MGIKELLKGKQIVAVYCNQWGDTGKGKFSDYFASEWADVIARGTGGNNAGHTIILNGKEVIFHLLPAGIVHDAQGKINILGKGMVIDPHALVRELDELTKEGITYNNLQISRDAHVVMKYHIEQDKAKNESQKNGGIGSTGRGIGPCYTDKIARSGIRMFEFLNENTLRKKLEKIQQLHPERNIDTETLIKETRETAKRIQPHVQDTDETIQTYIQEKKKILIEGAQGLLLSIEHGTYPYVTSSDCSLNGMANGIGISAQQIDLPIGIIKFPFMTRVGGGPFPTELGGRKSEQYCSEEGHEKEAEKKQYGNGTNLLNSENEFEQGIGIRIQAKEYGATTGRPRRIGWTDLVAAKYAVEKNGPLIILTKADCTQGAKKFKLCTAYKDEKGNTTTNTKTNEEYLRNIEPIYKTYEGYENITNVKEYEDLPETLKEAIKDLETTTKGTVIGISTGPERKKTIWKNVDNNKEIEEMNMKGRTEEIEMKEIVEENSLRKEEKPVLRFS